MLIERLQRRLEDAGPILREQIVGQIITRTLLIVSLMAGLLTVFMWVAARKADELSIDRQQRIISTVLEQNFRSIEHDQESSTVWDDSVEQLRAVDRDEDWIDANLGIWFHTYFGHDEIVIVDDRDRIVYVMQNGVRQNAAKLAKSTSDAIRPLIMELRVKMRAGAVVKKATSVLTPGAIDLGLIHGHPAIVSAKPVVTDSGKMKQLPGTEFIHVSVRYLDGSFIDDLSRRYQLESGQFSSSGKGSRDFTKVPLTNREGALIGYFRWIPFRPGTAMLGRVAPALVASLVIVFLIVLWLLRKVGQNMMQLSEARSHAQQLADHDALTSLANRAMFDRALAEEITRLQLRGGGELALLYIDLDHFKKVNDHLGHPTGDALIRVAAGLLNELAPNDLVARLGGDEFAIIHRSEQAAISGAAMAETIHRALAQPIDLGNGEVLIGASIGIALAPGDATDAVELVRRADIALYDAKHQGRGRTSFFTDDMGERIRQRREIEDDLREAMRDGQGLRVVYQPYFAAQSGKVVGAEALIRWEHAERGTMLPEQFIPIAEESGLIETLSEWVLEQACLVAARWPSGIISVNLSGVQLRNPSLAERVYAIVRRTRLAPSRLELEITETSFVDSSDQCRRNLGWLRDIGIAIALDDFGTGYSSFRHLRGFEVDRIKIDHSFVSTVQPGQAGSPVIQAIVDLARASGLTTTAEGIETEQQRQFLKSIGCNVLQGFLLARPIDAGAIDAYFIEPLPQ